MRAAVHGLVHDNCAAGLAIGHHAYGARPSEPVQIDGVYLAGIDFEMAALVRRCDAAPHATVQRRIRHLTRGIARIVGHLADRIPRVSGDLAHGVPAHTAHQATGRKQRAASGNDAATAAEEPANPQAKQHDERDLHIGTPLQPHRAPPSEEESLFAATSWRSANQAW